MAENPGTTRNIINVDFQYFIPALAGILDIFASQNVFSGEKIY